MRSIKVRPRETTAQLGELIAAAFDGAARYSQDPRLVAHLATRVVIHVLRHARRMARPRRTITSFRLPERQMV